jgi:hypothetical protein
MDEKLRCTLMACWLIATGIPVAGCQPENRPPPPGKVSLQFLGMSGTDAEFQLGNGTAKAIGLIGARSLVPGFDFSIVCNGSILNDVPSEQHGWGERDAVLPGQSMQVVFRAGFEKGSHCVIQLKLQNGQTVDSNEFQP